MDILHFAWEDDEICHIYVNDRYAYSMEHGPHGWDGMKGIRDALIATANILEAKIQVSGDPGI